VRGGAFSVKQAGGSKYENAGTNGNQPRASRMGTAQPSYQVLRRSLTGIPPPGKHDGARSEKLRKISLRFYLYATAGPQRSRFQRTDLEAIPVSAELGPGQPEDLHEDSKLKRTKTVVREHGDTPRIDRRHGRILSNIGIPAYRKYSVCRAN
jgi:hypothetical protein